ncbi:hypothetical protein D3C71_2194900 [compost metagenome]
MDSSAGMKKLVLRVLSSSIITPLTNSAGNPTRARMEATKMPQTVSGMRISVMPSQRACSTVVT